jgi:hypothetical protein
MKPLHQCFKHNTLRSVLLLIAITFVSTLYAQTQQPVTKEVKDKLEKTFKSYRQSEISFEKFVELNKHIYQPKAIDKTRLIRPDKPGELMLTAALQFSNDCDVRHDMCANGDFESGSIDVTQWRGGFGTWGGGDPNPFALTEGFISGPLNNTNSHQTIVGAGVDPFTGIQTVSPTGGSYALRLGNSVNGFGTEFISKTVLVTAGRTIIPFYYALVFQDPNHAPVDQPAFSVKGYDCNGNELPGIVDLGNGSNKAISDAQNPFFQSAAGGSIAYKDWSLAQINLSAYIGQVVTLVFLNKDCGLGGHFGYTYLDNLCTVCTTGCPYNLSINPNTTKCGIGQICVDYALPKTGSSVGDLIIDLDIYQNGAIVYSTSSPLITTEGAPYCFNIDPAALPLNTALGGFDYIVTGRFSINSFSLSPLVVGQPPNGQIPDPNNDYLLSVTKAVCKNIVVSLVNGVATITPQDVDGGSTATCGIKSMQASPSKFDCSNIGLNNVTLTVFDNNGDSATCNAVVAVKGLLPACNIKAIPSSNVYTGGIPTNIYLGYGPQSVKLDPQPTGGSSFTYEWTPAAGLDNPAGATPTFTPTAEGTYIIQAKITNEFGCVSFCKITICVLDVRVPGTNGQKIYVCHYPQGNLPNVQTISVSINAVSAHIFSPGHGDKLGTCEQVPCGPNSILATTMPTGTIVQDVEINRLQARLMSASGSANINLYISSGDKEVITVKLHDMYGRLVKTFNGVTPNSMLKINENLTSGIYYAQVIQGKKTVSVKLNVLR